MENTTYRGQPIRYGYTGIEKRLAALRAMHGWQGARALDVGCGNGAYTLAIGREAALVWGVDIDRRWLCEFIHHPQITPNIGVGQADGERLPFRDAVFDVVFCIETLEHIAHERAALSEMRRILRNDGTLLLTAPNKWFPFETHGLRGIPHSYFIPFASWLPEPLHRRYANARIYTEQSMRRLLEETGWRDIRIDWMLPPFDMLRPYELQPLFRAAAGILDKTPLRRFGVSLIVAATK